MVPREEPTHSPDQGERHTAGEENRPQLSVDVRAETEEDATILSEDQLKVPAGRLDRTVVQRTPRPALTRLITGHCAQQKKRNQRGLERSGSSECQMNCPVYPVVLSRVDGEVSLNCRLVARASLPAPVPAPAPAPGVGAGRSRFARPPRARARARARGARRSASCLAQCSGSG